LQQLLLPEQLKLQLLLPLQGGGVRGGQECSALQCGLHTLQLLHWGCCCCCWRACRHCRPLGTATVASGSSNPSNQQLLWLLA
jgi:hypothetical protein